MPVSCTFFDLYRSQVCFFQLEVGYNHDYKLRFNYRRFLSNCSLLSADLSVNIKISVTKEAISPIRCRLQHILWHTGAANLNSFNYPFQPPDHVSHSYDKDSASCLKKSEIAILLIRFAITSLLANKNSRSWEKEFPILVARVSKIEILLKIFKYNAIFLNCNQIILVTRGLVLVR